MQELIKQFNQEIQAFSKLVENFPPSRRQEKLFAQWSLQDIIAHLSGWAIYQQKVITMFLGGHAIESAVNIKILNNLAVSERKKESWEEVTAEWHGSVTTLSSLYGSIPKPLLNKSVYSDKSFTPSQLLHIEIYHLKNTHGPQVKKVIKSL